MFDYNVLNSNKQYMFFVCFFFSNLDYFYGPYLICKCSHTCINSSHSLFYFIWNNSQLMGFGEKECRDMYMYVRPKASK